MASYLEEAYELHHLDCLDLCLEEKVDLIYLDPPYSYAAEDKWYGVGETFEDYMAFMASRLNRLERLLAENGNILLHVDYRAVHYLKVMMDRIFGRKNFQNEIVWCYSSPSRATKHLPRKHQTLLWYGRGKYFFQPEHVGYAEGFNVGGKNSWAGESVDAGKYTARGKLIEDWWSDIPYLCRNEKEKVGYDTQKPLKLLRRILRMFSKEGARVLDPFAGSGTTGVAAIELGRYPIMCDIAEKSIETIRKRLNE